MQEVQSKSDIALVTLSYAPDFKRCELLVKSAEKCMSGCKQHYVIVDRRDFELFKALTSPRTTVLVAEDILPSWIFRVPAIKGWWLSLRTLPIRNWIIQQLVKMSVFDGIDEDIVAFCDSDNAFVKPINLENSFVKGDQLALFKTTNFKGGFTQQWIEASQSLLGLEDVEIEIANYVSNMITWNRKNAEAMRKRIEEVNGTHWIRAICKHRTISEYVIYGTFVEYTMGLQQADHFLSDTTFIKASWSLDLSDKVELDNFFGNLHDSYLGVMIHSKDGLAVEKYRDRVMAFWE